MPPPRTTTPPDPNTPIFGDGTKPTGRDIISSRRAVDVTPLVELAKRQQAGITDGDVMNPPYAIENAAGQGVLSDRTAYVSDNVYQRP